ncbi:MAG: MBL fold metallo-hydrolase [Dehalococcoidaceae bacterium]|nr:MBL fold metallo-hydrolase [Dehalococcoidaceae bacterium]
MDQDIKVVSTRFIFNVNVNCYLIKSNGRFFLIDTGMPGKRHHIERELVDSGCLPGNLELIILTHGDKDHCGNAVYFREKFGARIAMHRNDSGMTREGDMFFNRKPPGRIVEKLFKPVMGLGKKDRFEPDILLEDGDELTRFGWDATILHLPGHSSGSIAILARDGALFCGDILADIKHPDVWSIVDNAEQMSSSVAKIKRLNAKIVYPGHGRPFPWKAFERLHG